MTDQAAIDRLEREMADLRQTFAREHIEIRAAFADLIRRLERQGIVARASSVRVISPSPESVAVGAYDGGAFDVQAAI